MHTFHPRRNFTILYRSVAITVRIATKGRARCICNYRAGKLLWNYTISQQFFPSPFKKSSTDSMPVISLRRYVENTPPPPPSLTSQSIGLVKITGILLYVIITLIIVLNIFFPPGVARFPTFFFFFFLSLRNPDTSFHYFSHPLAIIPRPPSSIFVQSSVSPTRGNLSRYSHPSF